MRKLLFLEQDNLAEAERPPKAWMDDCLANVKGDDPGAICGNIWHNVMGPAARKRAKSRGTFEEYDQMAEALEEQEERPPKGWMDSCVSSQEEDPKVRDAGAVCATIWKKMGPSGKRQAKKRGAFEATEDLAPGTPGADDEDMKEQGRGLHRLHVPWERDPELGGLEV